MGALIERAVRDVEPKMRSWILDDWLITLTVGGGEGGGERPPSSSFPATLKWQMKASTR